MFIDIDMVDPSNQTAENTLHEKSEGQVEVDENGNAVKENSTIEPAKRVLVVESKKPL